MTVLDEQFNALPDEIPLLEQNIYTMPDMQPFSLLFSPAVAFRVYDEFERASITRQEDGSLRVDVAMPQDVWVVSYLLSFGTGLTILEPQSLREQLANHAKAIFEQQRK